MRDLTPLFPYLYAALDVVSREMVGFIPAVTLNATPANAAIGTDVKIPVPGAATAYDVVAGPNPPAANKDDVNSVTFEITKSRAVPIIWDGEEEMGYGNSGMLNPTRVGQYAQAMRTLVNEFEADIAKLYPLASRAYGTPGTTPFASGIGETAQMRKILADNGAPMTDLQLVVDTTAGANLRSNQQLTKANEAGTDATLRRGELLALNGFSIRESGQILSHAAGSLSGALVNNASGYSIGAKSIAYDTGTGAAKAGDVVKFGTGKNQYVVSAASAASPLNIAAPGLRAAVADNDAITALASYTPSLAFSRSAIVAAARTPAMPEGGDQAIDIAYLTDPVSGVTFQICMYPGYKQMRYEVGLAWGCQLIKPEHVAILVG